LTNVSPPAEFHDMLEVHSLDRWFGLDEWARFATGFVNEERWIKTIYQAPPLRHPARRAEPLI
jgi:hypothetical protein